MTDKCNYYRESEIFKYTPDCCVEFDSSFGKKLPINSVHETDIEGKFCQFCGREIELKEGVDFSAA